MNSRGLYKARIYEIMIQILLKVCAVPMRNMLIQSGDNFAHVTTAELSWHV